MEARKYEGYLFPETYFFNPDVKESEILITMRDTFYKNLEKIQTEISTSTRTLKDVIIMASLLEEEANNPIDRKIIAGILW
ncbi:MAG: endolytic transglycosylase MltG, partial [bacterium]|nr:endolytic transglycosylase MltG [bacterium]